MCALNKVVPLFWGVFVPFGLCTDTVFLLRKRMAQCSVSCALPTGDEHPQSPKSTG